jgi:hypothetical protein
MTKKQIQTPPEIDISTKVMEQISGGGVKMKPKAFFALASIMLGISFGLLLVLSIILISFLSFRLRFGESWQFLQFGISGLRPFITNFPFIYIVLLVVIMALGIRVLKQYDFSYRHNWWAIVLGLVSLILTIGIAVDQIGTHQRLMMDRRFRPLYHTTFEGNSFVMGKIAAIDNRQLTLTTPDGDTVTVDVSSANLPRRILGEGSFVRVVGQWSEAVFVAEAVMGGRNMGGPREGMGPGTPMNLKKPPHILDY